MNEINKSIQIIYCSECGMLEDAINTASIIERGFGIPVELKEGHNGVFIISMNVEVIFNNNDSAASVPAESEVIDLITRNYK